MGGDLSRRELLRRGAVTGGRAGAAGVAGIALVGPAGARAAQISLPPLSEVDWLGRLVSVEQLLLFCYDWVLDSRVSGPRMQRALGPLRAQEQAHVQALRHQLRVRGAGAPDPPSSQTVANQRLAHRKVGGRLGHLRGAHDALRLLLNLEQVVVGVYFLALNDLADPQLIRLTTQIVANDAQHESMINLQLNPHDYAAGAPYGLVQGIQ